MTTVIKTGVDNFFVNNDETISMKYDPSFNKYFLFSKDKEKKEVPIEVIGVQRGGQIFFNFNNNKYIIDDGYRNKLLMAGYLYLNVPDSVTDFGYQRKDFFAAFTDKQLWENYNLKDIKDDGNEVLITMIQSGYEITVDLISINKLVGLNLRRAAYKLPMYPTERGMSKHTTLYYKVYVRKLDDTKVTKSKEELTSICKNIIYSSANTANLTRLKLAIGYEDTLRVLVKECELKRVILKWEEDL